MPPDERNRPPTRETGPANTTISALPTLPNVGEEAWVIRERAEIEAAVDARLAQWARLGLKLPPRGEEVFRLARINNAVDLAGRLSDA